jgi:flagellar biosynthesis protein FlhF
MAHVFRGRTLSEAREAAEVELGPELIVLQKRKVKRKGLIGVLGATEFEIEAGRPVSTAMLAEKLRDRQTQRESSTPNPFTPAAYDENDTPMRAGLADINRLHDEVRAMRATLFRMSSQPRRMQDELKHLRQTVDSILPISGHAFSAQATALQVAPQGIAQWLSHSGIDGAMARDIVASMQKQTPGSETLGPGQLIDGYRDALADRIRVKPWPLAGEDRQLIALIGPPGVGKTTTAAKIAARAIADHNKTVTFISCDTFRVGAVEQIKRFAKLLGSRLMVVKKREDLCRAVQKANTDIVMIDTSGRGPTGSDAIEAGLADAEAFKGFARHVLLCLPASARYRDTADIADTYRVCEPTEIAVTKLDLTRSPGGLLHGTGYTELPVTTLCMGQRVPEDIAPASAGRILDYLSPRQQQPN